MGASSSSAATSGLDTKAESKSDDGPVPKTVADAGFEWDADWKPTDVLKREVRLPTDAGEGRLAFGLGGVLTRQECAALIRATEACRYEPALVNIGGGRQQFMPEVRKGLRVILDDPAFAAVLFERLAPHLPDEFSSCTIRELNERMRFLKYDSQGDGFASHHDGVYPRPTGHPHFGDRSLITVHLYLNKGYKGGTTRFLSYDKADDEGPVKTCEESSDFDVLEVGDVLVFEHHLLHCGSRMTSGTKYTLRTDVMYTPKK